MPTKTKGVQPLKPAIQQLESKYEFESPDEVKAFLRDHRFLVSLLEEAYPQIEKAFGTGAKVALEVVRDAEIPTRDELFAYVWTTLSAERAMDHLSKLDEEWLLDHLGRTKGKLNINLRFE